LLDGAGEGVPVVGRCLGLLIVDRLHMPSSTDLAHRRVSGVRTRLRRVRQGREVLSGRNVS
jgi:hypothetical protein